MNLKARKHRLIDLEWPDFGVAPYPPPAPVAELQAKLDNLRAAMEQRDLTHVVLYADREHFANMTYFTGFDPRFEESLLIVGLSNKPLILVGNECEGFLGISSLINAGLLRHERFQSFSLLGQPRDTSRPLLQILMDEGIGADSSIGAIGYKYFLNSEHPDAPHALDIPSYIADTLRDLVGPDQVFNATDLLMHPGHGLRAKCSPFEIAYFEYANGQAAEAVKRILFALREGITDHAAIEAAHLNGDPFNCHITFGTGPKAAYGLCGPTGQIISKGQPLAFNIAYWGSNICRAGWIAETPADLPQPAADYIPAFAGPYFEAMGEWFQLMRPGTPGREIFQLIQNRLPFDKYGIYLNPGHLIHLDEWVSSPIYAGSDIPIASGMAIQVDVIPQSSTYFSTRMEDGIVIAGADLRSRLKEHSPDCYSRCQARRKFMTDVLGFDLPDAVLPLSNTCAIVPPLFLKPNSVLALEQ